MYKMCDFNIGHVYDIWMTADCDGKGRSQRSNIFRLSLKGICDDLAIEAACYGYCNHYYVLLC